MTNRGARPIVAVLLALVCLPAVTSAKTADVPLVEAVRNLDLEAARALIDQGVDVNAPAVDGGTALHWAVYRDHRPLVELLLDAGAGVTIANRYGVRPLSLASLNGSAEVIEQLLRAGADPNTALPEGETVVMTAARTGNADAIRVLISHGADVNARDDVHGQTALMWAAAEGHAEAIHLLAEVGGDINGADRSGHGPGASSGSVCERASNRFYTGDVCGPGRASRRHARPARGGRRCQRHAVGWPECAGGRRCERQLGAGGLFARPGRRPQSGRSGLERAPSNGANTQNELLPGHARADPLRDGGQSPGHAKADRAGCGRQRSDGAERDQGTVSGAGSTVSGRPPFSWPPRSPMSRP